METGANGSDHDKLVRMDALLPLIDARLKRCEAFILGLLLTVGLAVLSALIALVVKGEQ